MSGRRTQMVVKKKTDPTTVLMIILAIGLGGVIVYEIYRRNKINKEQKENQEAFNAKLKKAKSYLSSKDYNKKLNDPLLTQGK